MDNSTTVMTRTEDTSSEAQIMDTQMEGQENNMNLLKKKQSKKEEQEVVENVQFEESVPKKKKKRAKSELFSMLLNSLQTQADQNLGC